MNNIQPFPLQSDKTILEQADLIKFIDKISQCYSDFTKQDILLKNTISSATFKLINNIFEICYEGYDMNAKRALKEKLQKINKGICNKKIRVGDLSFSCFDCEQVENDVQSQSLKMQITPTSPTQKLICEECFSKGEHSGHRVQSCVQRVGSCACGEGRLCENFINANLSQAKEGFCCKNHQGFQNVDKAHIISQLPAMIRLKIAEATKMCFLFGFFYLENAKKNQTLQNTTNGNQIVLLNDDLTSSRRQQNKEIGREIIRCIFKMFEDEVCTAIIFAETLLQTIPSGLSLQLYHDCGVNSLPIQFNNQPNIACSCSLLKNIFRFNKILGQSIAQIIKIALQNLLFIKDFLIQLAKTYVEMFACIIVIPKLEDTIQQQKTKQQQHCSVLRDLSQGFVSSEIQTIWCQQPGFDSLFERFCQPLLQIIRFTSCSDFGKYAHILLGFLNTFDNLFLFKDVFSVKVKQCQGMFIVQIMECLLQQNKQVKQYIPFQSVEHQRVLCLAQFAVYKAFVSCLSLLSHDQNIIIQNNDDFNMGQTLTALLQYCLKNLHSKDLCHNDKLQLQFLFKNQTRLIACILCKSLIEECKFDLNKFCVLSRISQKQNQCLIKESIRILSQFTHIEQDLLCTSDSDPNKFPLCFLLNEQYKGPHINFYNTDILAVQLFLVLASDSSQGDEDDMFKNLLEGCGLNANKYQHQAQTIDVLSHILQSDEKTGHKNMADMLFVLATVSTDELAFLHESSKHPFDQNTFLDIKKNDNNQKWVAQSLQCVLASHFTLQTSFAYANLQNTVLLNMKISIALQNIAKLDDITRKFAINDQAYLHMYEPYAIYGRFSANQQQRLNDVVKLFNAQEADKYDAVIGTRCVYDANSLQHKVIQTLSKSKQLVSLLFAVLRFARTKFGKQSIEHISDSTTFTMLKCAVKLLYLFCRETDLLRKPFLSKEIIAQGISDLQELHALGLEWKVSFRKLQNVLLQKIKENEQDNNTIEIEEIDLNQHSQKKVKKEQFNEGSQLMLKQQQVKQEFIEKQLKFSQKVEQQQAQTIEETNLKSTTFQITIEVDEDEKVCPVCMTSTCTEDNPLGFVVLLQRDNLSQYYYRCPDYVSTEDNLNFNYEEEKLNDNDHNSNTLQMQTSKHQKDSNGTFMCSSQSGEGMSMKTCGHMLHLHCYNALKVVGRPQNNSSLFKPHSLEVEYSCPQCKFQANTLIPRIINNPNTKTNECISQDNFPTIQNINQKSNLEHQLQSVINQVQDWFQSYPINSCTSNANVAEDDAVNCLFNDILFVWLLDISVEPQSIQQQQQNYMNDSRAVQMVLKCQEYQWEEIFLQGLQRYLQNNCKISQNLFAVLSKKITTDYACQESMQSFVREVQAQLADTLQTSFFSIHEYYGNNNSFSEEIKIRRVDTQLQSLNDRHQSVMYGLDMQIINAFSQLSLVLSYDPAKLREAFILLSRVFLSKVLFIYAYALIVQTNKNKINQDKLLNGSVQQQQQSQSQSNNQNDPIQLDDIKRQCSFKVNQVRLQGYGKPYAELVIGIMASLRIMTPTEQSASKEEEAALFNSLKSTYGTGTDLNDVKLIEQVFSELLVINESCLSLFGAEWCLQLNNIFFHHNNNTSLQRQSELMFQLCKNPQQKLAGVVLPSNWSQLAQYDNTHLCSNCGYLPKQPNADLHICLICGEVLCSKQCGAAKMRMGNLSNHALTRHAGKTVYLNKCNAAVLMVDMPRAVFQKALYVDAMGQAFTKNRRDWQSFTLDIKAYHKIVEAILSRRIPQEVTHSIIQNEKLSFISFEF